MAHGPPCAAGGWTNTRDTTLSGKAGSHAVRRALWSGNSGQHRASERTGKGRKRPVQVARCARRGMQVWPGARGHRQHCARGQRMDPFFAPARRWKEKEVGETLPDQRVGGRKERQEWGAAVALSGRWVGGAASWQLLTGFRHCLGSRSPLQRQKDRKARRGSEGGPVGSRGEGSLAAWFKRAVPPKSPSFIHQTRFFYGLSAFQGFKMLRDSSKAVGGKPFSSVSLRGDRGTGTSAHCSSPLSTPAKLRSPGGYVNTSEFSGLVC